jgi:hypothetical protein
VLACHLQPPVRSRAALRTSLRIARESLWNHADGDRKNAGGSSNATDSPYPDLARDAVRDLVLDTLSGALTAAAARSHSPTE